MSDTVTAHLPLKRWQGEKAVYHLVSLTGESAETIATHSIMELLKRVQNDVEEIAKVEAFPRLEGRQMLMVLAPK